MIIRSLSFALVVTAVLFLSGTRAEAGIPIPYESGQRIFDCGPLPESVADFKADDGHVLRAGYACDITGVLWTDFYVRNCKPVAYFDETTITPADAADATKLASAIAAKYPESSMKRGVWNKYGWMILVGVIVLGILSSVLGKKKKPNQA